MQAMRTLEILEREHEWIGWMTESLEALVARTRTEGALPLPGFELLTLFEVFADGRHQDKEEEVLFPELLSATAGHDREVLAKLIADHEAERGFLAGMRENARGAVAGDPVRVHDFLREATHYLKLQRAHMLRENEILLPMIARLLSPEADERVAEGFAQIEGGVGDAHGLREQVLSLLSRSGLPKPPAA